MSEDRDKINVGLKHTTVEGADYIRRVSGGWERVKDGKGTGLGFAQCVSAETYKQVDRAYKNKAPYRELTELARKLDPEDHISVEGKKLVMMYFNREGKPLHSSLVTSIEEIEEEDNVDLFKCVQAELREAAEREGNKPKTP